MLENCFLFVFKRRNNLLIIVIKRLDLFYIVRFVLERILI